MGKKRGVSVGRTSAAVRKRHAVQMPINTFFAYGSGILCQWSRQDIDRGGALADLSGRSHAGGEGAR